MTAPGPRVGEIEARLADCRPCKSDCCGSTECQTERDAIYLLAELRKAHEALARVEALADESEPFKGIHGYTSSGVVLAEDIYAAVAATNGDGEHIPGSSAAECPCQECRDCCATFAPDWKEPV